MSGKSRRVFRYIVLLLFLGAAAAPALAVTLSGKIIDRESGESIPSAAVMVVGTTRGAAADVEGLFSLPDLDKGWVEIKISALGYQPLSKKLDLRSGRDQHLLYKLVPEAVQMTEVSVEANAQGQREYTPKVAEHEMESRELSE